MSITIDQIIARIPDWSGRTVAAHTLPGGRTNVNYRVDVDDTSFVVRIPGASTDLLAVDRENECYNTRAAAEANVGPRVKYFLPDVKVMVLEFLKGTTMDNARLQAPGMPTRMAKVLRKLHAGPRFLHDFNMFRLTEYYLQIVADQKVILPEDYRHYLPEVARIETAFERQPLPSVPCHNDLLAENYIDDGHHLWLIDFEYSGNNDPTFELGNTCQELEFDHDRMVEMCTSYFGTPYPEKLARIQLNMILSDVGWTLWAAIQAKISRIDFNFAGWARERWERAKAKFNAPEYEEWLRVV